MKNKILSFFISFLFSFNLLTAQFVIDKNNFPVAGLSYHRNYSGIWSIGNSGQGQTYDFSTAFIYYGDTVKYLTPEETGFGAEHPDATCALAQWGDVSLIWYFNSNASNFWTSGGTIMGDFGEGYTTSSSNHSGKDQDTLLSTDYKYGHQETEYTSITFYNLLNDVHFKMTSYKNIEVDGEGKLITPIREFPNVLRVKYTEYKFDTVLFKTTPKEYSSETLYYYKYFAEAIQHPVIIAHLNKFDEVEYIEMLDIPPEVYGCTDVNAYNFNPLANTNDGSCKYCGNEQFNITSDTNICTGAAVLITSDSAKYHFWSTGDSLENITVQPDTSQSYSVLIGNNINCLQSFSVDVNVYDEATASFWFVNNKPAVNQEIQFINASIGASEYIWNFDDTISNVSNSTNPVHIYNTSGTKNISLIAVNPCESDTFLMPLYIGTTGFEDFDNSKMLISAYPNPVKDIIHIEIPEQIKSSRNFINLYNMDGTLIYKQFLFNEKNLTVDISDLGKGIYFIQLITDEGIFHQKVIKI